MRIFSYSTLLLAAAALSFLAIPLGSIAQADDYDAMRFAAESCSNNRVSFANITCDYRIRSGRAANVDEALSKGATADIVEAKARWFVRDRCLCQVIESELPKTKPVRMPDGSLIYLGALPCVSRLSDGTLQLSYEVFSKTGRIDLLGGRPGRWDYTPFDLGIMGDAESTSPGAEILEVKKEQLRLVAKDSGPDKSLIHIELQKGDEGRADFWFDAARGYLPVEVWHTDAKGIRTMRMVVTASKECSNGRWFPMRSVIMNFGEDIKGKSKVSEVRETIVDTLYVDTRPADNVFAVHVDKDATLNVYGVPGTQHKLGEATDVGLGDLAHLRQLCEASLGESQRGASPVTGAPAASTHWMEVVLAVALLVVVLGGAVWYYRKQA